MATNTISTINTIKIHIIETIFQEYPFSLNNQHPFDFFMECDDDLEVEGFESCEEYGFEDNKALKGLMSAQYENLASLIEKVEKCNQAEVKVNNEAISCELELSAFDIARYGQDELYEMVEQKLNQEIEIYEMQMIPIKLEDEYVTYKCVPTKYKQNS